MSVLAEAQTVQPAPAGLRRWGGARPATGIGAVAVAGILAVTLPLIGFLSLLLRSQLDPQLHNHQAHFVTFGIIDFAPGRVLEQHLHHDEDDAFYILEGELTFAVEGEEVVAGPGTFVLVPPGVHHTFANRGDALVRLVNIHAPAGFDLRLEQN